jgi:hypothetical protein
MVQYIWNFSSINVSNCEGLDNVVVSVDWNLKAIEGDFSANTASTVSLEKPDAENFIAYENVTEEILQSWVEKAINYDAVERIKNNLVLQINLANGSIKNLVLLP